MPSSGPCARWATAADVADFTTCDDPITNDALFLMALDAASAFLWRATGRQFSGVCEAVVRPTRRPAHGWRRWGPRDHQPAAYLGDLGWVRSWGDCGGEGWPDCDCHSPKAVELGAQPIVSVTEVLIDGDPLPITAWRIDESRWLVRTDGGSWPLCQDLAADAETDDNTWQVAFRYGKVPPRDGVLAAAVLACETYKSLNQDDTCKLPGRVTSVDRDGIRTVILDPLDFQDKGRVGLPLVDQFIKSVNPHGLMESAAILSPDIGWPAIHTAGEVGS